MLVVCSHFNDDASSYAPLTCLNCYEMGRLWKETRSYFEAPYRSFLKGLKTAALNFNWDIRESERFVVKTKRSPNHSLATYRQYVEGNPSLPRAPDQLAENHVAWSRGVPLVVAPWDGTHCSITLYGARSSFPHNQRGKILHDLASPSVPTAFWLRRQRRPILQSVLLSGCNTELLSTANQL